SFCFFQIHVKVVGVSLCKVYCLHSSAVFFLLTKSNFFIYCVNCISLWDKVNPIVIKALILILNVVYFLYF
uniref:Uncharacterized protein n=1 Tax=Astyanax mexicanus TaxID=7994 RepID=A0A3B1JEP3_ASTMX